MPDESVAAVETAQGLANGSLKEQAQPANDSSEIKHAPKLFTENCEILWDASAESIHNLIRGLSPYPGAFTFLQDKMLKVFKSKKIITSHKELPGTFSTDGKTYLRFATTDGFIYFLDVQLQGKKKLTIEDFLCILKT